MKNSISCIEERFHCKVSDDEISYLALHLARCVGADETAAAHRAGHPMAERPHQASCRQKLIHQINEIDIIAQESFLSIHHCDLSHAELIISTIELSLKENIPVLLINPLLHDYDILRLKDVVKDITKEKTIL